MIRIVLALLLAFIPSNGSLLRRAAVRVQEGGRSREVTMSGTLEVTGAATQKAQLVLHFPLGCRIEGENGLRLSVSGKAEKPAADAQGNAGPALQLLQMACPLIAYRGLSTSSADQALHSAAIEAGVDLNAANAISRLEDRVVWVLGADARDAARPQLWLYKDNSAPARLLAQSGADVRLLEYGNPAAAEWFPRVVELWQSGQLAARFSTLETRGFRGVAEGEEDDSRGNE